MVDIIQGLRQEHRNIESLLRVLERELSVFDRGERPDYEVVLAVIDYFKDYPDSCHRPKEDMIVEKVRVRDAVAAATINGLEAEHQVRKRAPAPSHPGGRARLERPGPPTPERGQHHS